MAGLAGIGLRGLHSVIVRLAKVALGTVAALDCSGEFR